MKRIVVAFLLVAIFIADFSPVAYAQVKTNTEELTDEEKQRLQELEDHGFWEALYEIFLFNRLILSNDYKNFQDESTELEEWKSDFKKLTGVEFYSRGNMVAPDFWPRVFRRDEPYAEQFPAIEFYFPLKEVDNGYELDIQSDLFFDAGKTSIGCLTKERLDEIEQYINKEYFNNHPKFEDDDETNLFLNTMYDDLFKKLMFYVHPSIKDKQVCVGEKVDLGDDLVNFTLTPDQIFTWSAFGQPGFDGLIWQTTLEKETTYKLSVEDGTANTCELDVKVKMKENCENSPAAKVICVHPVSNMKILVDPGTERIVDFGEEVVLGGSPTAKYEGDFSSEGKFNYYWKLNDKEVSRDANYTTLAWTDEEGPDAETGGEIQNRFTLNYTLIVEDKSIFYKEGEYFQCHASIDVVVHYNKGPKECINSANNRTIVVKPGEDVSVCYGQKIDLSQRSKNNLGNDLRYTWISARNSIQGSVGNEYIIAEYPDIVILKVEDLTSPQNDPNDPYFSCISTFDVNVNKSFEPRVRIINNGEELIAWRKIEDQDKTPILVAAGNHKIELQVVNSSHSECGSVDLNAFTWRFTPNNKKIISLTGNSAQFSLADNGPKASVDLLYNNKVIVSQPVYLMSASASHIAQTVYGYDDYKRENEAKHVSVKNGGVQKLQLSLYPIEAKESVVITSGESLSLNASSFTSQNQIVEIGSKPINTFGLDLTIPVRVDPKQITKASPNLLTLQVHPFDEIKACANIISAGRYDWGGNQYLSDIQEYFNTKVFSQAVVSFDIHQQVITSDFSSEKLDLSSFPKDPNSELNILIRNSGNQSGCGKFYIYLLNKNIVDKDGIETDVKILKQSEFEAGVLPGEVLLVNVNGENSTIGTQEQLTKFLGRNLARLLGISDVTDDKDNLMNPSGTGLKLRLEQWKQLRSAVNFTDFSPVQTVEAPTNTGTWSGRNSWKDCPKYKDYPVNISYKPEVELYEGGVLPLSKIFNYQVITPQSDLSPEITMLTHPVDVQEAFTDIMLISPLDGQNSESVSMTFLNDGDNYKQFTINEGSSSYNEKEVMGPGIFRYEIKIGTDYSCYAFTRVKMVNAVKEFRTALEFEKVLDLAEIIEKKFRPEDHAEITVAERILALTLLEDEDEEEAIVELVKYVPKDQANSMKYTLCEKGLLESLRQTVDFSDYTEFVKGVKSIAFGAIDENKILEWAKKIESEPSKNFLEYSPTVNDELKIFPWYPYNNGAVYKSLDITDCSMSIYYCYGEQTSGDEIRERGDKCMDGTIKLHPLDVIAIHFVEGSEQLGERAGKTVLCPAITLKFLQDKETEENIYLALEALGFVLAGVEYAGAKEITKLMVVEVAYSAFSMAVTTYRQLIWDMGKEGQEFLSGWDQLEMLVGVVGLGRTIAVFPKLAENLPKQWELAKQLSSDKYQKLRNVFSDQVIKMEKFLSSLSNYLIDGGKGAGRSVLGDDEALKLASTWLEEVNQKDGVLEVLIHGAESNFKVFEDGVWKDVTVDQLISLLEKEHGDLSKFEKIYLLSCNAAGGDLSNNLATSFASKTGRPTYAADDNVWVHSDGNISVGTKGVPGTMYEFTPDGSGKVSRKEVTVTGSDDPEAVSLSGRGGGTIASPPSSATIYKLGTKVHYNIIQGQGRQYYFLDGDNTQMISILDDATHIADELKELEDLRAIFKPFGSEELVISMSEIVHEGKKALLMPRYERSSAAIVSASVPLPGTELLNQKSLDDLKQIKSVLSSKGTSLERLQFLVNTEGRVVLFEPGKVTTGGGLTSEQAKHLDEMIFFTEAKLRGDNIVIDLSGGMEGSQKVVYPIPNEPDMALALLRTNKTNRHDVLTVIDQELESLKELKNLGLNVVEAYPETIIKNGSYGFKRKFYPDAEASLSILEKSGTLGENASKNINMKTWIQLTELRKRLIITDPLHIEDLQFLILSDGSVVIFDPRKVVKGQVLSGPSLTDLDELIDFTTAKVKALVDVPGALQHVKYRDWTVQRTSSGIGGCHDINEFNKYSSEYVIVSRNPHSVSGVEKIEYQIYAMDKTGKPTTTLKSKIYEKTTYDPAIWTDDKLEQALTEAILDVIEKNNGTIPSEWIGTTKSGIKVHGYYRNNKITSFYFD